MDGVGEGEVEDGSVMGLPGISRVVYKHCSPSSWPLLPIYRSRLCGRPLCVGRRNMLQGVRRSSRM